MKKRHQIISFANVSFLSVFLFLFARADYLNGQITLISPTNNEIVQTHAKDISAFLSLDMEERREVFNNQNKRRKIYKQREPVLSVFEWKFTNDVQGPFVLEISESKDFSSLAPVVINMDQGAKTKGMATAVNFFIGEKYFWRVKGNKGGKSIISAIDSFLVDSKAPRLLKLSNVPNVRDLGGWIGLNGRRVRQGMIYRSSGLNYNSPDYKENTIEGRDPKTFIPGKNRITADGKEYVKNYLNWKIDLDLRSDGEVGSMKGSPAGEQVKWVHNSSSAYSGIFRSRGEKIMADNFRIFTHEENYPLDFHCISGADRTGSLAMILNGVLGVSLDDLTRDWEVSAYSSFVYEKRWDQLVEGLNRYGDSKTPFYIKIERYLHDIGITQDEIVKFRSIMLEK